MDHFDLNDFRKQLDRIAEMGPLRDQVNKTPGMGQMGTDGLARIDPDAEVRRILSMMDSMTPAERREPGLIDLSRRNRIAAGSGVDPRDVSVFVQQFAVMAAQVTRMARMSMMDKVRIMYFGSPG
jgi:signal recognition particle subunit SRP54